MDFLPDMFPRPYFDRIGNFDLITLPLFFRCSSKDHGFMFITCSFVDNTPLVAVDDGFIMIYAHLSIIRLY